MFKIQVKAKSHWPLAYRKAVTEAMAFAMKYYCLDASIKVKLVHDQDHYGKAVQLSDGRIIVWISNLKGLHSVLLTVFHEITHVKQYVQEELLVKDDGTVLWKNKERKYNWESPKAYDHAAWELEAFKMEKVLIKLYEKQKVLDISY